MLNTKPNIEDADGFYAELMEIQDRNRDPERALINARLILILANHIGDREVLRSALLLAKNILGT
ncbi:hypothetical protein MNBD_ALPHA07-1442 [hydrothermal vent metagenome]|uniref:DUF2783 domain-containing protein n=1 Tax=hydrothermal vent metagenome TaxID=652676 RepID=A0A3B0SCX9_9ZZZZ